MRKVMIPAPARQSQYGVAPQLVTKRVAEFPEMTSLMLSDLFADTPPLIYPSEKGISAIRDATRKALERVDMTMIKPHQSVNICASHHGFTVAGGQPYTEMLKILHDVILERTGCKDIRLRAGVGLRFRETEEYIKRFELDTYFGPKKATGVAAYTAS